MIILRNFAISMFLLRIFGRIYKWFGWHVVGIFGKIHIKSYLFTKILRLKRYTIFFYLGSGWSLKTKGFSYDMSLAVDNWHYLYHYFLNP
jgi:hypothetical protein